MKNHDKIQERKWMLIFCQCLFRTSQYLSLVYLTYLLRMSSRQTATKNCEVLRETKSARYNEHDTRCHVFPQCRILTV